MKILYCNPEIDKMLLILLTHLPIFFINTLLNYFKMFMQMCISCSISRCFPFFDYCTVTADINYSNYSYWEFNVDFLNEHFIYFFNTFWCDWDTKRKIERLSYRSSFVVGHQNQTNLSAIWLRAVFAPSF